MHVRVCVDCGEEYRPEIATCADCGGQLEDRHGDSAEGGAWASEPEGGEEAPESDFTVTALHAEKATDLTTDADRLLVAGIPFRLRSAPRGGYVILVTPADRDRALALLGLLPDRSGEQEGAMRTCPACETSVDAAAAECPECGLTIGDEDEEE
jgi:predicted amidophosphoribosyltransferase